MVAALEATGGRRRLAQTQRIHLADAPSSPPPKRRLYGSAIVRCSFWVVLAGAETALLYVLLSDHQSSFFWYVLLSDMQNQLDALSLWTRRSPADAAAVAMPRSAPLPAPLHPGLPSMPQELWICDLHHLQCHAGCALMWPDVPGTLQALHASQQARGQQALAAKHGLGA